MSKRNNKDCNGDNLNLNNKKLKIENNDENNIHNNTLDSTPLNQKDENKLEDGKKPGDEKKPEKKKVEKEIVKLNEKIETLDDLIKLAKLYDSTKEYNINLKKLNKILPSLEKLKGIIGMKSIKDSIVGQIIFFLNEFENQDMLHTIIQGPPGVGKTTLGKIIGELYYYLDIIKPVEAKKVREPPPKKRRVITFEELLNMDLDDYMDNRVDKCCDDKEKEKDKGKDKNKELPFNFKIVKRSDLIAGYLGQSAIKCQKVIDDCEGGVMFIDEAYSLGNEEGRDSFAKEVIDTINQNLSEQKSNFLCIIAGYKHALDKCFFSYNEGLRRRFPFVYTIEKYTPEELCLIYKKMVSEFGWNTDDVPEKFFKDNYECFKNQGGDIETLFFMCKIEHGKRTLFEAESKKKINIKDLESAFKMFKVNKELKEETDDKDAAWRSMYT